MARFAAPPMIARKWGRIVNVTTSFDTMLAAGLSAYGASKAALEASSAIWAKDLAGTGVSVNILVPGGPTETEGFFSGRAPSPAGAAQSRDHGTADRLAGFARVRRHHRLPLHRARLGHHSCRRAKPRRAYESPIGWPTLAEGASAARGHAM